MYSEREVDTRARRDMDFLLSALQVVKGQIAMAELGQREAALEAELGPCFDAGAYTGRSTPST